MFQNIKDRLHLIYIALTGKYFICVSYNKLDRTTCKVKGAHAVVNLPANSVQFYPNKIHRLL